MAESRPAPADWPVQPLTGRLPPQCLRDVDALRRAVHTTLARETPSEAVAPDGFREVLLTGATGFVGRFLLRALLRRSDRLIVHCLIRSESAEHGLARLRDTLEHTEIREEICEDRVRVVPGDLSLERFGLTESVFARLCHRIDAVYHAGANVDLVSSYADIREANVLGMRSVLELCLSTRFKHLFYCSTMGIFPEYFCDFGKEYRHSRIDDQMPPDLKCMKKTFPLGVFGYPWSKLVAEQGVLFAQAAGMPGAIFRLPNMGLSSTGFTQANSLATRLFAAATLVEKVPLGFSIQRNAEPVDTVSEICAAISLNPDRRFTIYHCCDPEPPYEDLEVAYLGFYWQSVPYASFRRSCQALGDDSPLRGHWVLLDHFAPYWFGENRDRRRLPISDRAIREDCPDVISWPGLLIRHARSYDWINRHRPGWPCPILHGRLDLDGLMGQAEKYAGRMGVSFEQAYPEWLLAGLRQLLEALELPDARLRKTRISHIVYGLTRALRNNAALARELSRHPEIDNERITHPVFIVGANRSGTTFLQRLLSRDSRFWSLRRYELIEPVLPGGEYATVAGTAADPRRAYAEELLGATNVVDTLSGIHTVDIDEPEEDLWIFWLTFCAWTYAVAYHAPGYGRWLSEVGSRNSYAYHRRVMQHFTWQRRKREPLGHRQWLLKMPFHLRELDVVAQTYPDAFFIQTHRAPVEVMGSWCSIVDRIRGFTAEHGDPHEVGREQLAFMSGMLNSGMRFRTSQPQLQGRWADVRYADLVDNPMAVVRGIYARFGWPLDPATADAMHKWLALQEEQRRQEPRHEYRLENYGLTSDDVNEAFASYLDFAAARGCA